MHRDFLTAGRNLVATVLALLGLGVNHTTSYVLLRSVRFLWAEIGRLRGRVIAVPDRRILAVREDPLLLGAQQRQVLG